MRVPRPTLWATLAMVFLLAACAANGDATRHPDMAAAGATAAPTGSSTPTPSPTPTAVVAATPVPLPSAQPMSLLWEAHGPVTDKTSTTYIALNPIDETVWVGVPFENRFWIFSPDGEYLESWGEGGTGPGQFDFVYPDMNPNGFAPIAFAPDGSFVVGDTGNYRVQQFDADRTFARQWGQFGTRDGEFNQIVSIATDGSTVYVADGEALKIQVFDWGGKYLRTFGADDGLNSVALGPNGRIYAVNSTVDAPQILAILNSNEAEISRTVLSPPSEEALQLAVDAAGYSYIPLEAGRFPWTALGVVQVDPGGQIARFWDGGGDFLGVSPAGDALYVTRGTNLDTAQWTFVRKYALSGS